MHTPNKLSVCSRANLVYREQGGIAGFAPKEREQERESGIVLE